MNTPEATECDQEQEYLLGISETNIQDFLEVEIESTPDEIEAGQENLGATSTEDSSHSSVASPVNSASPRSRRSPYTSSSSSSSSDSDEESCPSPLAPPCSPITPKPSDADAEESQPVSVIQWGGPSQKKQWQPSTNEAARRIPTQSARVSDTTLNALRMLLQDRNERFQTEMSTLTLYRANSPDQMFLRDERSGMSVPLMDPNPDPPPAYNPNLQPCIDLNCPYACNRPHRQPQPHPPSPDIQIVQEIRRDYQRDVRVIASEMTENGVTFFGPPGGTGGLRKRSAAAAQFNTYPPPPSQPQGQPPYGVPEPQQRAVTTLPYIDRFGYQYRSYRCSCCQMMLGYHRQPPGGEIPPVESPKIKCTVCGRCYFTEIQLKRHLKRHDEKRYTCQHCHKRFHTRGEAKAHSALHAGEKPFTCSICLHSYSYASTFFAHLQIRHRTTFEICAQCQ